jgi:pyridoxal phosphate enzyme (YggS family)
VTDGDRIGAAYRAVLDRIARAAERRGRSPSDVTLVAISKTFSADVVREAIAAGVTDLGENRAQELKEKVSAVGADAHWHFVGHLQTNKVRFVVGHATLIHSVDRFGLAEAVAKRARSTGLVQEVLVEVNVSREAAKQGVEPARAVALAEEIDALDGLKVTGLMAMAPFADDPEDTRPFFAELAELGGTLVRRLPDATALSMGMSRDFEVAVEEGATLVRVGEAIFGPRPRTAAD